MDHGTTSAGAGSPKAYYLQYQPTFGDVGFHVDFSFHFHLV
jgi:hypothetical protein